MPEDLVRVAESFVPEILANFDRIDVECQLPPDLAGRMAAHNLFCLYAPQALGGPELDPLTAFRVVEIISQADGSAGWCVFNGSAITAALARLTVDAVKEIFGDPPAMLGSGSARPEGTATITEGGYIINGRWNYLSGIDHSTALFLNCRLLNPDGSPARNDAGSPAMQVVVAPVASGTVIDNWTTLGMRGTASNDCEYSNVFVPAHHSYRRGDPSYHPGPLYNPAQTSILISWTLAAANALGMARGAMDAFHDLATGSGTTNSPMLLRERAYVQIAYGECEAVLDGARTYVLDAVGSMWDAQVHQKADLMDRAVRSRLAITHAIRRSVDVVDRLFNVAGTNAIHRSVGLERFFRDLHVSGQHISGLPNNFEYGGQVLMGAETTASLYT
ncbi:MAG: acyl-CoA dehydrogenase family protein [Chloroflexota bacterium]|nr:acyl-CoA dehydrogenase family protein [Chloroflexota bacterium]MDE2959897.1 acyl-CoA dehydrogenase family protein [Chloroflexota bacterium]